MHGRGVDQRRIWLLAGTGEGPELARELLSRGWRVSVSVVTAPAALPYEGLGLDALHIGALAGPAAIAERLHLAGGFDWVLDATHPFAITISAQLQQVCAEQRQSLLRLERPRESGADAVLLHDLETLKGCSLSGRRLLIALGGRCLGEAATAARSARAELFARVLPSVDGLRQALAVGLPEGRLAVLRPLHGVPPGAVERALCRRWRIDDVVCRQSGGVTEHLWREIAREQGVRLWLLRRPDPPSGVETVTGVPALLRRLEHG